MIDATENVLFFLKEFKNCGSCNFIIENTECHGDDKILISQYPFFFKLKLYNFLYLSVEILV